ncbi:hypothetical protein B0H13DRAFT_2346730 [Mycena leptocephala]|nr:hypothetical protein B0H13DRAFT_2346730 [Mycena leptocephala]
MVKLGSPTREYPCAQEQGPGYALPVHAVPLRGAPWRAQACCDAVAGVQHTIERSRMHGGDDEHRRVVLAWAPLTDAAAEDVRRQEVLDPVVWDSAWVCALCPAHYETRVTHAAAVEYLQSDHKIRELVEGKHFIYFVGAERTPRVPALLLQEGDVAKLRCNLCSHGKLRALRGIRRHVTDKHKRPAPSAADWTRVERILRTTLPPPAETVSGRWAHNIGTSGIEVYGRFLCITVASIALALALPLSSSFFLPSKDSGACHPSPNNKFLVRSVIRSFWT